MPELNYLQRGYLTRKELEDLGVFPPREIIESKRVAIIECVEDIPCNPCEAACSFNVIHKESFTKPGKVDWENCNGCAACVAACPGQSVFLQQIKDGKGYVTMPYELLPEPRIGSKVALLDRAGEDVGEGRIVAPTFQAKGDAYPRWVVTVEMDSPDLSYEVRAIRVKW